MMQGNIEPAPWVPFVLLWPFTSMSNPCASLSPANQKHIKEKAHRRHQLVDDVKSKAVGLLVSRFFKVIFWCCSAASRPGQYPGGVTSRNHKRCSAASEPGQYPGGVVALPLCAGSLSRSFTLICFMCLQHLFSYAHGTYSSWADEGSRLILRAREVVSCVTETERYPDLGFPLCQTFTSHLPQQVKRAKHIIKMSKTMLGTRLRLRL